jgi:hypothetical protein
MKRERYGLLCLALLALAACNPRPVAENPGEPQDDTGSVIGDPLQKSLDKAGTVDDLNRGRVGDVDAAVDGDTQ